MFGRTPIPRLPPEVGLPLLIIAGIVLLLFGWRLYRLLLVVIAVLAGGLAAAWIVRTRGLWAMLGAGLPAGLACGLLSQFFERYGVFMVGVAAGAAPVFASEAYFFSDHAMYFAALACGLIAGSLAVILWKPAIILCFSVLGATMVERSVFLAAEHFRPGLGVQVISQYNLHLCLSYLALILMGVLVQYREARRVAAPVLTPKEDGPATKAR